MLLPVFVIVIVLIWLLEIISNPVKLKLMVSEIFKFLTVKNDSITVLFKISSDTWIWVSELPSIELK